MVNRLSDIKSETAGMGDPRLAHILKQIRQMAAGNLSLRGRPLGLNDSLDQIMNELNNLAEQLNHHYVPQTEVEARISEFSDVVVAIASLDFTKKAQISDKLDLFDAVATGLNMLGEELFTSTVSVDYVSSILESMADTLIVLDQKGMILTTNRATQELLGYTERELEGKFINTIFANQTLFSQVMGGVLSHNTVRGLETQYLTKTDKRIPILLSAAKLYRKGVPEDDGIVCVGTDITARKRVEEALALVQAKTKLLATISHELRTPLHAIIGYTDMIQAGAKGPLSAEQQQILDRIMVNGQKLDSLVSDLLQQAQMEAGKMKLDIRAFAPVDLLHFVETVLSPQAEAKGLQLNFDLAVDLPDTINGDVNRLQDILLNLTGNAIKFTNDGSVTIRLYRPDPSFWVMEVADTGAGISAEDQTRIFDAFSQVDGSITRQHGGTGLGLAITKELVDIMGGYIALDSKEEQGSTFTILLPLH